jgi:alkylhydroperoxidase/carboxymuconolactone decarboxylase family protein YurZ
VSELPKTYLNFRETFPELADAYDRLGTAAHEAGPLTAKARELVKLGIAIGARQEGAVHSHTRRALGNGASKEEVLQVVALAVTSIGFGPSVAAFSWVTDEFGEE